MVAITSAAGVLSLLDETDETLVTYALEKLDALADQFWAEIADSIGKIEVLYENQKFKSRHVAALVAARVYFHLGSLDDAVTFALGAGDLFRIGDRSEFVETVVATCIDRYIAQRRAADEGEAASVDAALVAVVERMFQRCFEDKEFKQAIGIALEARRLDMVEAAIQRSGQAQELCQYVLDSTMALEQSVRFQREALRLVVEQLQRLEKPDYVAISECLVHLDCPSECAALLKALLAKGDEPSRLMAYQIAFNLDDNATQGFLQQVLEQLGAPEKVDGEKTEDGEKTPLANLADILSGRLSIQLYLEFLYRSNKTDLAILKKSKQGLDGRSSAYHAGVSFANAFMHAGTTSDEFLRQNLQWLSKATNWTKFSATASLGVIHKGQIAQGQALLAPYLPKEGVSGSAYSEGGALFALGLIHANHGAEAVPYLTAALKATNSEVVQHGACLGLGVAAMATGSTALFDDLKSVLFTDSAVAGEAAGLAMGLVMLGTGSSEAFDEMLEYAQETQHEKIIRGLAVGMALLMYSRQAAADAAIERLLGREDSILRYGGVHMLALAYAGTSSNKAIRRLLHLAVSDVNDDVRRAAVTALGFILFKQPRQVPRVVQLLAESYNPHVRYGASLALGIGCAGTGVAEALELLEPLAKDPVDFVRQGALMALAMVLIQHNDTSSSGRATATRELYAKILADRHEDPMAKFGSVLGQGILDAGGRNVTLSLASRNGQYNNLGAIVGMTVFTQLWYWYPLSLFLSLAFTPTVLLGLDAKLRMPKFEFVSRARPSMFAYPPPTKEEAKEKVEKVAAAVLSTTARAKAREARKEKAAAAQSMDVDSPTEAAPAAGDDAEKAAAPAVEKAPEPQSETLGNLARVVPLQRACVEFGPTARFVPATQLSGACRQGAGFSGIVMVHDRFPDRGAVEFFEVTSAKKATGALAPAGGSGDATGDSASQGEAPPPASFEVDP